MKKTIKAIAIVLFAILVIASLVQGVSAMDPASFKNNYEGSAGTATSNAMGGIVYTILNIVQVIGTGVAIIMLVVLAIKYISAAPGDKAEIKKHAVVYIVGAVVLFGASGILGIIKNLAGETVNKAGGASSGN